MESSAKVYAEPVTVTGRLHELDVRESTLIEAVRYGLQFVRESTRHDPRTALGMLAWGKVTRGLRDRLIPLGWTMDNERNYDISIHPSKGYAIAVSAGDKNTGNEDRSPTTSGEKGQCTKDAVLQNSQLQFSRVLPAEFPPKITDTLQTWILLYHIDPKDEQIRVELSLPAGMNNDDRIATWHERIILTSQPFGSPPVSTTDDDRPDGGYDTVEVDVQRRTKVS